MCLINLNKKPKKLVSLLCMLVVVIKRKPKKISHSSFASWEISRVNSLISFLWGSRGEDHDENVEWLLYALLLI